MWFHRPWKMTVFVVVIISFVSHPCHCHVPEKFKAKLTKMFWWSVSCVLILTDKRILLFYLCVSPSKFPREWVPIQKPDQSIKCGNWRAFYIFLQGKKNCLLTFMEQQLCVNAALQGTSLSRLKWEPWPHPALLGDLHLHVKSNTAAASWGGGSVYSGLWC